MFYVQKSSGVEVEVLGQALLGVHTMADFLGVLRLYRPLAEKRQGGDRCVLNRLIQISITLEESGWAAYFMSQA